MPHMRMLVLAHTFFMGMLRGNLGVLIGRLVFMLVLVHMCVRMLMGMHHASM